MQTLLGATTSGVYRIEADGVHPEEGPPSAAFLANTGDATFALTAEGALWARSRDGRWHLRAERTVTDEPWSFGTDPRLPGRLYIGVSPALLYRSDDYGETWTACESLKRIPGYETWTFPPPPHIPHVRSIAVDREVVGGLYVGVEEGGVYRSPDGGDTWESLNDGLYWDVHTVAPAIEGEELYATTGAGFHRSDDAGRHWQHVTNGISNRYTVPLLVSQTNAGALFTAAAAGPPPSWRDGVRGALFRSLDKGESWQRLQDGLPEQFNVMVNTLLEDGDGCLYAAAGSEVFSSEDGGDSWRRVADGLPSLRSIVAA